MTINIPDKYINPLTELQKRPQALQERIFEKLFEAAEIAKFTPAEREAYQSSLKYYRDLKNVVDTSLEEGVELGLKKAALCMKKVGMSFGIISEHTGLSEQEIEGL
ncbi:MAG: PD-(D/E)XK nuclease family transposase [Chitinophagales bacterium]